MRNLRREFAHERMMRNECEFFRRAKELEMPDTGGRKALGSHDPDAMFRFWSAPQLQPASKDEMAWDEAEERKYKWLGYLGLGFTIAGAICGGIGAYS